MALAETRSDAFKASIEAGDVVIEFGRVSGPAAEPASTAVAVSDRIVLMSNGPAAQIGEVVPVTLSRPRSRDRMLDDPEYDRIRKHLLHYLAARDTHVSAMAD